MYLLQFIYCAKIRVDTAKLFILYSGHKHPEGSNTMAWQLLTDLSSAFNTSQSHILAKKKKTCVSLCVMDFYRRCWSTKGFLTFSTHPLASPRAMYAHSCCSSCTQMTADAIILTSTCEVCRQYSHTTPFPDLMVSKSVSSYKNPPMS